MAVAANVERRQPIVTPAEQMYEVGENVRLRSNGRCMTVHSYNDDGTVHVVWLNDVGELQEARYRRRACTGSNGG